jgi:hypothetical protein
MFFAQRKLLVVTSLLLWLAAVIVAHDRPAAKDFVTADGSRIRISLRVEKETFMLGETTYIAYEVENRSQQKLCLSEGGDYRNNVGRPERFKVSVIDGAGVDVPQPEVTMSLGGFIGCLPILAGQTNRIELYLPQWATLTQPGDYSIRVRHSAGIGGGSIPVDLTTHFRVVPTDGAKLGSVIEQLGQIVLKEDYPRPEWALPLLRYIRDARTIPYLADALHLNATEPFGTFEYFRVPSLAFGLARFNADAALAALEREMTSPTPEVRADIATALEESSHPGAFELLLKMREDKSERVRLEVAFGLGKVNTERSNNLLRQFLVDPDEWVRKAATDYLTKRGLQ